MISLHQRVGAKLLHKLCHRMAILSEAADVLAISNYQGYWRKALIWFLSHDAKLKKDIASRCVLTISVRLHLYLRGGRTRDAMARELRY